LGIFLFHQFSSDKDQKTCTDNGSDYGSDYVRCLESYDPKQDTAYKTTDDTEDDISDPSALALHDHSGDTA
jgi:hypothetical protein